MINYDEEFKSILLTELGIDGEAQVQMKTVLERLSNEDINLGKLDVSKLDHKQLNCLLDFHRALGNYSDCRVFFNADAELIITTVYRYQEEHQSTRYRVDWLTLMIDFVFNKQAVNDD